MSRCIAGLMVGTVALFGLGCSGPSKAEKPMACMLPSPASQLVGEWMGTDEKGNPTLASVFTVTSSGSAIREVMFPGTNHEMTNMYHMDGDAMVLTHYCAMGNQPRMKAKLGNPHVLDFQFESVTNRKSPDQEYMGRCTMTFKDADTMDINWSTIKDGKEVEHMTFHHTRKH